MWTTNEKLHRYYEDQRFTRCRDPQGLGSYPSQALFERRWTCGYSTFTKLFTTQRAKARISCFAKAAVSPKITR